MAEFAVQARMGADPELRPRVAAAVVRLALHVITLGDTAPDGATMEDRVRFNRRRSYALEVTTDVAAFATRAQWALACWSQSDLSDAYSANGGNAGISDDALLATLEAFWMATAP